MTKIPEHHFEVIEEHIVEELNKLPQELPVICLLQNTPSIDDNDTEASTVVVKRGTKNDMISMLALTVKSDPLFREVFAHTIACVFDLYREEATEIKDIVAGHDWCIHKMQNKEELIEQVLGKLFNLSPGDFSSPPNREPRQAEFRGTEQKDMNDPFDIMTDEIQKAIEKYKSNHYKGDGRQNIVFMANKMRGNNENMFGSVQSTMGNTHGLIHLMVSFMLRDERCIGLMFNAVLNYLGTNPSQIAVFERDLQRVKAESSK